MSFGMSELQFSGQNEAAILLKTKAQCKSYSKLRCHALSMIYQNGRCAVYVIIADPEEAVSELAELEFCERIINNLRCAKL